MTKSIFKFDNYVKSDQPHFDASLKENDYTSMFILTGDVMLSDKDTWSNDSKFVTVERTNGRTTKLNKDYLTEVDGINKFNIELAIDNIELDVIVMHGAAMVMHGIKETTRDIDAYPLVKGTFNPEIYNIEVDEGENIELGIFDFGKKGYICPPVEFEMMGGVKVQTLENIIKHKEAIGRQKDLIAIEQIKQHIAKRGN